VLGDFLGKTTLHNPKIFGEFVFTSTSFGKSPPKPHREAIFFGKMVFDQKTLNVI